jgi:hypothetical protein
MMRHGIFGDDARVLQTDGAFQAELVVFNHREFRPAVGDGSNAPLPSRPGNSMAL